MDYIKQNLNLLQFEVLDFVKGAGFTHEELIVFKAYVELEQFEKKAKIIEPGQQETCFRILQKGLIRQYYIFNGKEINTQFATQNDIICDYSSYMANEPAGYFIEAVEPSTVFTIQRENMDAIMMQGPKFIEFGKKIAATISRQRNLREMDLLNYDGLGRLQNFVNTTPQLFLKLPQVYIASYLNIKPETFSALKKKLK
jgi:CRP-like cAMP-binding protein